MKLFDRRPLCFGCAAALVLSLLFAHTGIVPVYVSLGLCVTAFISAFFLFPDTRRVVFVAASVIFAVSVSFLIFRLELGAVPTGRQIRIEGHFTADSENDFTRVIRITRADGRRVDVLAVERAEGGHAFEKFTADATLSRYDGQNSSYYSGKGVFFSVSTDNVEASGEYHRGVRYYAENLRRAAMACFYRVSDEADVLCRIFLGASSAPRDFTADMRSLGLSHLLAVSGLHVTALLLGLEVLLNKLTPYKRIKSPILGAVALVYMAVTGFTGSVVRASVMYLIMSLSPLLKRRVDPPTTLCAAACLIVAVDPSSVYDTGFLLSFTATLGVITFGLPVSRAVAGRLGKKHPFLSGAVSTLPLTFSALIFTLPVIAFAQGKLVLAALFFNVLASPVVALILYICPYLILVSRIPYVGRGLGLICDGLCSVLRGGARLFSGKTDSVSVLYPFVIPLLCVFFAVLLLMTFLTKKRIGYIAVLVAFSVVFSVFAAVFSLTFAGRVVIIVSTDKSGDAVAVCSRGRAVIYDFSPGRGDPVYPLFTALLRRGITRADYVLCAPLTDYHVQSVVRTVSYFDIDGIYLPDEAVKPAGLIAHRAVSPLEEYDGETVFVIDGDTRYLRTGDSIYVGLYGDGTFLPEVSGAVIFGSLTVSQTLPDVQGRTFRVIDGAGAVTEDTVKVIYID